PGIPTSASPHPHIPTMQRCSDAKLGCFGTVITSRMYPLPRHRAPHVVADLSVAFPHDREDGSGLPWMQEGDARSRPWMAGGRIGSRTRTFPAGHPPPAAAAGSAPPNKAAFPPPTKGSAPLDEAGYPPL